MLDFFCAERALVVEVDGGIHEQQTAQDTFRTDYLAAHGLRVLRFRNEEIVGDLAGVVKRIVEGAAPTLPLSHCGGRGGGLGIGKG